MNRMWAIAAIVVAFIVFFYFFQRLRAGKSAASSSVSLSEKTQVLPQEETNRILTATNTGTLQAFIYPLQPQKTGMVTLCNPAGSANPGEPECSTGQYSLCRCVENDCSRCAHSGYVNVLNISNVIRLELLASPDAGRPKAAGTQLVIRTLGMASPSVGAEPTPSAAKVQTVFEETIPLPTIPFQKWTFITIAREGRRFDVYYNGKIVMSKRTQYVLDTRSAFGAILAGDPNLKGTITGVESFPEKLSEQQVLANYKAKADTTGQPFEQASLNLLESLPKCEGGECIKGPSLRPTSPLLDWETSYA